MSTNIVILGASGDLAKKKILPSLGELISSIETLNIQDQIIDIIPWSRKDIDLVPISNFINSKFNSNFEITKSIIGDYTSLQTLLDYFNSLQSDTSTIFYLSVPPLVNLEFVKNLSSLDFRNYKVILEKPYTPTINDFKELEYTIKKHKLESKILFVDHYLFKDSLSSNESVSKFLTNLSTKKIKTINVNIQESIDTQGREQFYDNIGVIGDMLFHLFNIENKVLSSINQENNSANYKIQKLITGQYSSYQDELGRTSTTPTAFYSLLIHNGINVTYQSSKKLDQKITTINLNFEDESHLNWNIYPESKIEYYSSTSYFIFKIDSKNSDHFNIFRDILNSNYQNFSNIESVSNGWELLNNYHKIESTPIKY